MEPAKAPIRITVKAQPGAKVTALAGRTGDCYKVRLAAPPVDGKANEALIRFLASRLKIPSSAVRIVRGAAGRMKTIEIGGTDAARVERALGDED